MGSEFPEICIIKPDFLNEKLSFWLRNGFRIDENDADAATALTRARAQRRLGWESALRRHACARTAARRRGAEQSMQIK